MNTMNQSIRNLKGFRDFLPAEKKARDFVMGKIVDTFTTYGFEPIESPTLEYAQLLTGKYGQEADKLLYTFQDRGGRKVGLRYDQTVPTARILNQYQNDLPKYFRRYQIQNVFRADKPQKGRYREFTQCDIDIFGSTDPIADAEILACSYAAFKNIGFPNPTLVVNDRQVLLKTLKPYTTDKVDVFSIIQSIDKLDKFTPDQVIAELTDKGLEQFQAEAALDDIRQAKPTQNLLNIIVSAEKLGIPSANISFNPSLARGLDYYTGMIFEIIIPDIPDFSVGSFGGGGRYDQLIQQLGGTDIPAVGTAFGFDRIILAAQALDLIPQDNLNTQVMVSIFDESTLSNSLATANQVRQAGIRTTVYPAADKLAKQFKYAANQNIPFVIIIGPEEAENNQVTLKNMQTGKQEALTLESTLEKLTKLSL